MLMSVMEFDKENPLRSYLDQEPDEIPVLFSIEIDHMATVDSFVRFGNIEMYESFRRETIDSMMQVPLPYTYAPFVRYLAVNNLDLFISRQGLPQAKPWIWKLIAISCLSLAAKMRKVEFSISDIQNAGFMFDAQTIQRMELLVLGALKWRMRSITPFSFVPFFIELLQLCDPSIRWALKTRATDIIFTTQNDVRFLEHKPSLIAASAVLYASREFFPLQFPFFKSSISHSVYVNNERLIDCCSLMQNTIINYDTLSNTETPDTVLNAQCSTSESETIIAEKEIKCRTGDNRNVSLLKYSNAETLK